MAAGGPRAGVVVAARVIVVSTFLPTVAALKVVVANEKNRRATRWQKRGNRNNLISAGASVPLLGPLMLVWTGTSARRNVETVAAGPRHASNPSRSAPPRTRRPTRQTHHQKARPERPTRAVPAPHRAGDGVVAGGAVTGSACMITPG